MNVGRRMMKIEKKGVQVRTDLEKLWVEIHGGD
jgi:hypothetical protein